MERKVDLFVEERKNGMVDFATWCVGTEVQDKLYVDQVSVSDLMSSEEILCVDRKLCRQDDAGHFFISFEVGSDPRADERFKFMKASEVAPEILDALGESYEEHWDEIHPCAQRDS